ncbi:MAG: hypothetical protein AAGD06_30280 [Acidobacteriota bacterium]
MPETRRGPASVAAWVVALATICGFPSGGRASVQGDLELDHVEIVQVVQDRSGSVSLVAGRPAWVRAFPVLVDTPGVAGFKTQAKLEVETRVGSGPWRACAVVAHGEETMTVGTGYERARTDAGFTFEIPKGCLSEPGGLRLRVELIPDSSTDRDAHLGDLRFPPGSPAEGEEAPWHEVKVLEMPPLDIAWVSFRIGKRTPGRRVTTDRAVDRIRALFPVAADAVTYRPFDSSCLNAGEPIEVGRPSPGEDWAGRSVDASRLFTLLYPLWESGCDSPTQLVGWLPGEGARWSGRADAPWDRRFQRKGRAVLVVDDSFWQATLAHEIAHNLGLGHLSTDGNLDERLLGELGYEGSSGALQTRLVTSAGKSLVDLMVPRRLPEEIWATTATYGALQRGLADPQWIPKPVEATAEAGLRSGRCGHLARAGGLLAIRGVLDRRGGVHFFPVGYFPHTAGNTHRLNERRQLIRSRDERETPRYRFEVVAVEGPKDSELGCESIPWSPRPLADGDPDEAPFSFLIPNWKGLSEVRLLRGEEEEPVGRMRFERDRGSRPAARSVWGPKLRRQRQGDLDVLAVDAGAAPPRDGMERDAPPSAWHAWLRPSRDKPWEPLGFDLTFDPHPGTYRTLGFRSPERLDREDCTVLIARADGLTVETETVGCN